MNWFSTAILILGVMTWLSRKPPRAGSGKSPTVRLKGISEEKIKSILEENDLQTMASILDDVQDPMHRHLLLTAIVQQLYPGRGEQAARNQMYHFGQVYLDACDSLLPAAKEAAQSEAVAAPVLKCMAIAREEDQHYEMALRICKLGIKWDLDDGTKSGYPGRLQRIQKKRAKS